MGFLLTKTKMRTMLFASWLRSAIGLFQMEKLFVIPFNFQIVFPVPVPTSALQCKQFQEIKVA